MGRAMGRKLQTMRFCDDSFNLPILHPCELDQFQLYELEGKQIERIGSLLSRLGSGREVAWDATLGSLADIWAVESQKGRNADSRAMLEIECIISEAHPSFCMRAKKAKIRKKKKG